MGSKLRVALMPYPQIRGYGPTPNGQLAIARFAPFFDWCEKERGGMEREMEDSYRSGCGTRLKAFDALGTDGMHDAAEFLDPLFKPGQLVL
jgi:hypothetical protein